MKKTAIALLVLTLLAAQTAFASNVIRISQVYGGGGNTGATYSNDYVELFNSSNAAVSIGGWSLQYGSATGTVNLGACTNCLTVLPTGSVIGPCGYFLIQLAAGTVLGAPPLPTPDYAPSPNSTVNNLSASAGKIGLKADGLTTPCVPQAAFQDLVGYGTTNCAEGTAAGGLSNTTAVFRNSGGLADTDVNSADCTVALPAPRNSASPPNSACVPTATEPSTWGGVKSLYR
jgi:hypothetical protein